MTSHSVSWSYNILSRTSDHGEIIIVIVIIVVVFVLSFWGSIWLANSDKKRFKEREKKYDTPIGGIEPPAAVWETAMLATTPYRILDVNCAWFSLDQLILALFVCVRSRAWFYKSLPPCMFVVSYLLPSEVDILTHPSPHNQVCHDYSSLSIWC